MSTSFSQPRAFWRATLICGCALTILTYVGATSGRALGDTILLDDFSSATAAWPLDQNSIGNPEKETALTGVLGGVRKTFLREFTPGGGISRVEVGVLPSGDPEFFEYVATVNTQAKLALLYDADPGDGSNPNLNLDMIASPVMEVTLSQFDYANSLPMNVNITVSDGVNEATRTQVLSQIVNGPPDFTLSFDFSAPRGLVDFSDIDSVEVEFDPGAAADFRINSIQSVPEPAGIVLLALGSIVVVRRNERLNLRRA